MGFNIGVEVFVAFAQEFKVPMYMTRFAKRMVTYLPDVVVRRKAAALLKLKRDSKQPPKKLRRLLSGAARKSTKSATAKNAPADDTELDEDAEWSDDDESFTSLDKKSKTLLEEIRKACSWKGKTYYSGEFGMEFEFNHVDLVERAFDIFVERVLGKSKTGLKLRILREFNAHMNVEFDPMAFIVYEPSKVDPLTGGDVKPLDVARVNMPWGQRSVDVPTESIDEKAVSDDIQKVCDALGVTCIGTSTWKLIAAAGGG